ncbi:hypothetical protein DL96DRAFT_260375 [Flagelloscypha sp. PMI_526]|nr:hypothetical protein DL96DRAFT_260375 [Flagelloscypha sp. PMI_526]
MASPETNHLLVSPADDSWEAMNSLSPRGAPAPDNFSDVKSQQSNLAPTSPSRVYKWHIICVVLHIFGVILHLILVIVMNLRLERRFHVELGSETTLWSTIIQILLQGFALVYLSAALFVSQKLFMQRILATSQTLTGSHDQFSSWLGLGSAVNSLFKQHSVRSGVTTVVMIALYLAASAISKVTTSALFQLPAQNVTRTNNAQALMSFPFKNYTDDAGDTDDTGDTGDTEGTDDTDARYNGSREKGPQYLQSMWMTMMMYQQDPVIRRDPNVTILSSLGLDGNTVYDVIPVVANATGKVLVNAHTFNVECYSFDPALEQPFLNQTHNGFGIAPISALESVRHSTSWHRAYRRNNSPMSQNTFFDGSSYLPIQSMYKITDGEGRVSNQVNITNLSMGTFINGFVNDTRCAPDAYAMDVGSWSVLAYNASIPAIQMALCSLNMTSSKAFVDASTRVLMQPVPRKHTSSWRQLDSSIQFYDEESDFLPFGDEILSTDEHPTNMVHDGFDLVVGACRDGPGSSETSASSLSYFDVYGTHKLELLAKSDPNYPTNSTELPTKLPTFMLHEVEKVMEDYIALYMFTQQKANDTIASPESLGYTVSVDVPFITLVSTLTLNPYPLYVGLAASVTMLVIAIWIASTTPTHITVVDNVGVLQLLWLSNALPGRVSLPTEPNLRKAGIRTSLRLENGVTRRATYSFHSSEDPVS